MISVSCITNCTRVGSLYKPDDTLKANGPFDLVLHAVDLSAERNSLAPYSLEAYLDGELYYQIAFDRLLRDDNNQLGMLYDMTYSTSRDFYFKIFSQEGFALENRRKRFDERFSHLADRRSRDQNSR